MDIPIGSIVLVKSSGIIPWLIAKSFHRTSKLGWEKNNLPSTHNGFTGLHKGEKVVFEAMPEGFIATPLKDYLERKDCELMFAMPSDRTFTPKEQMLINKWGAEHLGTDYDYWSFVSHVWRLTLRLPPLFRTQKESEFYCTEAVNAMYQEVLGLYVLGNTLPSPYTVEKRIEQGYLVLV